MFITRMPSRATPRRTSSETIRSGVATGAARVSRGVETMSVNGVSVTDADALVGILAAGSH
jgi:hypothetical protein